MPSRVAIMATETLAEIDALLAELPEPSPYRRALLPAEKYVDLAAIDKGFDQGKNDLIAAVKPLQERQIADLLQQASRFVELGRPVDVDKLEPPLKDEMRMAIFAVTKEQYRAGRSQVQSEYEKARGARLVAEHIPDMDDTGILRLFHQKAQALTAIFSVRLKASLATILNLHIGEREFDPDEVSRDLLKTAEIEVGRNAGEAVIDATNIGRAKEAGERGAQIGIYTSLLDAAACDQCTAQDGKEFIVGSAEYWGHNPPYQECDWPPNCRCAYVFEWGEAYWRNRVSA